MGREIRRVPANWQHPQKPEPNRVGMTAYQPMYDETFADAARKWKEEFAAWERGERPDYFVGSKYDPDLQYWEWDVSPPDRAYYRTYSDDEATWFQVYETVTEGTPVTPPFETEEALIEYLVAHGTWSDEYARRAGWETGPPGWPREAAESFVKARYAPSMVVDARGVHTARDPEMYAQRERPDGQEGG